MTEIVARRVPGHQIPHWRQDQHRLRLDTAAGDGPVGVAILKPEVLPLEKCRLERRQQRRLHRAEIGDVHLRGELADIEAIEKPAQVADLVARLEKKTGRKVRARVTVDKALIGGVKVVIGDKVIDGSAKAQLTALENALKTG